MNDTHRAEVTHIDEFARKARVTNQWFLEKRHKDGTHPITANNHIKMLICGEEGFGAIADDLAKAQHSVDLVCWGFDPGMELRRKPGTWPRGDKEKDTFGGILKALATRKTNPVKVRLLIYHRHFTGWLKVQNMPGHTEGLVYNETSSERDARFAAMGAGMGGMGSTGASYRPAVKSPAEQRADHCVEWWRWALNKKNAHLIEVTMRDGDEAAIQKSLGDERTKPSATGDMLGVGNEKNLLESHGTHHQKTVLIDYHHDDGKKAVGYVMGLNSLTGYWDTRAHLFNDKRRELERDKPPGDHCETFERVKKAGGETSHAHVRIDPYQDYACRIEGEALQFVNKNFCDAWARAGGKLGKTDKSVPGWLKKIQFSGQTSRLQVVRTQPEERDKTIRETYFHASSFARNYLYMENQYFQYEEWVAHLKTMRKAYVAGHQEAGKGPGSQGTLHLFIVIPRPELAQMAPRTFDTVKSLGRSDQMHDKDIEGKDSGQYLAMKAEEEQLEKDRKARIQYSSDLRAWQQSLNGKSMLDEDAPLPPPPPLRAKAESDVGRDARKIKEPSAKDLETMGLKVLIGMLVSSDDGSSGLKKRGPADNYRQIYIHSKLMVIDDAFFTIGSANLNQRSMVVDSEINIATDDHAKARELRKEVWGMHAGHADDCDGGSGNPKDLALAFKSWQTLMKGNDDAKAKGLPLQGFLCTFRDSKVSFVRYA
jgi:phosphatidylserine/phosphatidylglycerophosphate/cardiolipin synthase-like enzyme